MLTYGEMDGGNKMKESLVRILFKAISFFVVMFNVSIYFWYKDNTSSLQDAISNSFEIAIYSTVFYVINELVWRFIRWDNAKD